MKKLIVMVMVAVFALTCSIALAADPFFIIKGKDGVCKVIQAKEKTPASIAGPYKTKDEAQKVKEQVCSKPVQAPKAPAPK